MAQLSTGNSVFLDGLVDSIETDPDFYVWEHADHKRILPKVAAAEPGLYRSSRTPFWVEVMENLSVKSPVQETCVMKATQIGCTEVGNNWFCYVVDIAPGPMLAVFPTNDLARDHSKQKLNSTIEEMPWLKAMLHAGGGRESGNTMHTKMFPGGIFYLSGANTPVAFRSKSIRYLFLDDIDGFPMDVGGEGDPANLARKRTDTYSNRKKIYEVSTPTVKGFSRIEMSFEESDQRYYHVPCPHCGEYQKLEWGGKDEKHGIKFTLKHWEVVDVWYVCIACGERIDERYKTEMLSLGKWIPTKPEKKKRGYQLSSLYSPVGWVSWKQVADEFIEARGNPLTLKVWVNTRLGEPFEESGDQPDWVVLKARAEPYEVMTVPGRANILTAGVDTQDDRLAVVVRGWGDFEESWLVYYGELYGDPVESEVWTQLDNLLNYAFVREDNTKMQIIAMAVDAMGHRTQPVYNYCRFRAPRVMAIRGAHQKNKPVMAMKPNAQDVTYAGEKIKNGVMLWTVGTDTAKTSIYSRLRLTKGPGIYHWPIGLPDEYYKQLTSERLITSEKNGRRVREWVKVRARNEVLDCFDDLTEVLTKDGWKYFRWLKYDDEIATVNLKTDSIEYQKPIKLTEHYYRGDLVGFKGKRLDIVVTPKHRMLTYRVRSKNGKKAWSDKVEILLAKDVKSFMAIKVNAKWSGSLNKYFHVGDKKIRIKLWAAFLGWYVSEGHSWSGRSRTQGNMRYRVVLTQNPGRKATVIARMLDKMPWRWHLASGRQFIITSKALYEAVQVCGEGVKNKKVPQYIKDSDSRVIKIFIKNAIKGDGWIDNGKHRTYATISKSLADDMQELFLKTGRYSIIKERKPSPNQGGFIRGRPIVPRNTQYHVSEIRTKRAYLYGPGRSSLIKKIKYNGLVYCASVPNGTLICRRNGKTFYAGNCEVYCYAAALRSGVAVMGSIPEPKKVVRRMADVASDPYRRRPRRAAVKYKRPDWMDR